MTLQIDYEILLYIICDKKINMRKGQSYDTHVGYRSYEFASIKLKTYELNL